MLAVKEKQSNVVLKSTSVGNFINNLSPENLLIWKLTSKVYKLLSLTVGEVGVTLK